MGNTNTTVSSNTSSSENSDKDKIVATMATVTTDNPESEAESPTPSEKSDTESDEEIIRPKLKIKEESSNSSSSSEDSSSTEESSSSSSEEDTPSSSSSEESSDSSSSSSSEEEDQPAAFTWNGAASYATVNSPLVELFFKSVRDIPCTDYKSIPEHKYQRRNFQDIKSKPKTKISKRYFPSEFKSKNESSVKTLENYFDAAWDEDPLRTLKFVFYLRDCRKGKGEKKLFRALIRHMCQRGLTKYVTVNLANIPFYGCWKDLLLCFLGTPLERSALILIKDQLQRDILATDNQVSLCAKYAPSEGGAFDKHHHASSKLAQLLGINEAVYRRMYLSPLRAKLNIVEREMCARQWKDIQYEKVPSIATDKYKKAFRLHDEKRYDEYIQSVQRGEKKMNTAVLMPHQMIKSYFSSHLSTRDETVEAQWSSFLANRKALLPKKFSVLPVIDVSGSMFEAGDPRPIEVALSLGILVSSLNTDSYNKKYLTFHSTPSMNKLVGDSLFEQVTNLCKDEWGGSTNIEASFDLILREKEIPQVLLILSDMQFNSAVQGKTNWEKINDKFAAIGAARPLLIFWNLNGTSVDFPIPDARIGNSILLSGYNDVFFYNLLEGKLPNPLEVIHKILDGERYDKIKF